MNYSFDLEHAKKYGVDEAIVIHNFIYWIAKNKANKKHHYDNRTWTYNSIDAYVSIFPFWSKRQIERIINSLKNKEVIISGNYNKKKYDRTMWYAFKDESLFMPDELTFPQTEKPISPNSEMHLRKKGNGFTQTVKPIPDSNTVTNNKYSDECYEFVDYWITLMPSDFKYPNDYREKYAEIYDKLINIDKCTKDEIYAICKKGREDPFWKKNFLSPAKLRNNNKDGVKFYQVFKSAFGKDISKPEQTFTDYNKQRDIYLAS